MQVALFLAVFVVVASAGRPYALPGNVDTRDNCPPEGFTALNYQQDLTKLKPNGKYAICLTRAQRDNYDNFNDEQIFTWTNWGPFVLRNSILQIDAHIKLVINSYSAPLDWQNVMVTRFHEGENRLNNGRWRGMDVLGWPSNDDYKPAYNHKGYGNCGKLVDVRLEDLDGDDVNSYSGIFYKNCTGAKTTSVRVGVYQAAHAFDFEDCTGLTLVDPISVRADITDFRVTASSVNLVRPYAASRGDGYSLQAREKSNVTACFGFFFRNGEADDDRAEILMGDDDDTNQNTVALAQPSNINLEEEVEFKRDGNGGGIVYTMNDCPKKFQTTPYDLRLWTSELIGPPTR